MSHLGTSFSASGMNHKEESTKNSKGNPSSRAESKAGTSSSANKAQPKPRCRAHSGLKFVFKKKPIRPLLDFDTGLDHSEVNSSPIKVAAVSNEDQTEIVPSARDGANLNQTLNDAKLKVPSREAKPNPVSVKVKLQEISKEVKSPLPKEIQTQLISRDTKILSMNDKSSKNVKLFQKPSDTKPNLQSNQISEDVKLQEISKDVKLQEISKDVKLQEISKDVKSPLPQEIQTQLIPRDTKILSMKDNSSKIVKAVQQPSDTKPGVHSNQISKDLKLKKTPPSTAEINPKVKGFSRKAAIISDDNGTEIVSSARSDIKPNQPLKDTKLYEPTKGAKPNPVSVKVKLREISEDVKSPLPTEIQKQLMPKDSKIPMLASGTRPQLPSTSDKSSRDVKAVRQPSDTEFCPLSNKSSKDVKIQKAAQPSAAEVDSKMSTRKYGLHSGMRFLPKKQPTVAQPFRFQDAHSELKKKGSKD